jgi:hypothetical protein
VFNLVKALQQLVNKRRAEAPHLMAISERVDQIVKAFQDRQAATKDALDELTKLLEEAQVAESAREASNFSTEGFAVFWLLGRQGIGDAEQVARSTSQAFERNPQWRRRPDQERAVRTALYKALLEVKVKDVPEVGQWLLSVLKRSSA